MASSSLWQRFQRYLLEYRQLGFSLDSIRMKFPDDLFEKVQLRDGVLNFFVTFVEVRNNRRGARFEVEDGITSGDCLQISAREPAVSWTRKDRNQSPPAFRRLP